MSIAKDLLLNQLQLGQNLIGMLVKDLRDEECFVAPSTDANHPGWILGHLACSLDWGVSVLMGTPKRIAETTHELFNGKSECVSDPDRYPPRNEIDEMFQNSIATMTEAITAFDESRWNDPSPEEAPTEFFPTMLAFWGMQTSHVFWHVGQLAACRTALGKPRVIT